jgi:S-adenosylhomocysteine hydrolase
VHHLRATLAHGDVVVWGAGPVGKSFARELRRRGSRVVAFVEVDPRQIGREIDGVPVVAIDEAPRFAEAFALGDDARSWIRETVAAQGRRDGVDFVAVAVA